MSRFPFSPSQFSFIQNVESFANTSNWSWFFRITSQSFTSTIIRRFWCLATGLQQCCETSRRFLSCELIFWKSSLCQNTLIPLLHLNWHLSLDLNQSKSLHFVVEKYQSFISAIHHCGFWLPGHWRPPARIPTWFPKQNCKLDWDQGTSRWNMFRHSEFGLSAWFFESEWLGMNSITWVSWILMIGVVLFGIFRTWFHLLFVFVVRIECHGHTPVLFSLLVKIQFRPIFARVSTSIFLTRSEILCQTVFSHFMLNRIDTWLVSCSLLHDQTQHRHLLSLCLSASFVSHHPIRWRSAMHRA